MLKLNLWISELADRSGVSTRTIRYYIEEGLLPQPEIQGKYAVFSEDYLFRLQLIKFLKDAFLPLREIKNRLEGMTSEQVESLVNKFVQDPSAALAGIDYSPYSGENLASVKENASDYISRVMQPKKLRSPAQPAPLLLNQTLPATPRASTPITPESWQRIELAPGVELHIRQPVPSHVRRNISELIQFAKNLFKRED